MDRREFLKHSTYTAGLALAAGAGARPAWPATPPATPPSTASRPVEGEERRGDMLYRPFGRTGERVSALGLGGYHIGIPAEDVALRLIRTALDRGLTFLDNCWDYHGGESERRMGKALRDGYRERAFLMTKIDGRTRTAAAQQTDESLRRLQTDRVDLMQVHEVIRLEDADRMFADDGAIAALRAAQKAGKIRYIGFTGHKDPYVHSRTLEVARRHDFVFDAVQMPLNVMDAHFRSFEKQVLPTLVRDGIAVLGMKPLAAGEICKGGPSITAIECLHYALNLPTTTVITGIESDAVLDQALQAVRTFRPLAPAEVTALLARTADAAATGRYEQFKTSDRFDGTAHHPEWLG